MTQGNDRDRTIELMNREIDGVNTSAQSDELNRLLAGDADARAEFDALKALHRRLEAIPVADPPPHLIHRILSAVPFGRYPGRAPAHEGLGAWLSGIFSRPRLRLAATFATGLVAGIVLWAAVDSGHVDSSIDTSNLYGTMRSIHSSDGFQVVGHVGIETAQVRGEVRLHESDRKLLAEISLDTTDPIEWTVRYNRDDVAFEGFRQVEGDAGSVSAAGDVMTVSQAGSGRFILFFTEQNDIPAPMSIDIFSAGNLLYHKDLTRN